MEDVLSPKPQTLLNRRTVQWLMAPVVIVTIALGWKYPWLGFTVPVAMATAMAGGFWRGRWVCGNLCPRGGFYDRLIAPLAPRRPVPALLRRLPFRWGVFALLMGFMAWRLAADPTDPLHWGRVFWSVCALTTGIGLITAFLYHPRSWCAFCPLGTFQNAVGGDRRPLQIDASCRQCGKCEKACTMALPISSHKTAGALAERDCLKCSECVAACPVEALSWPAAKG